ncbi:hypothetical protein KW791_01265 [Candidatus Parcubacteria bacterium]|nr:hypothetical protein [Candidatus Parcubacteria bacterium]
MLLAIGIVLLIIWIFGVSLHLLGGLIYIFLVVGLITAVAHFLRGATR